jgi:hypothetical protein
MSINKSVTPAVKGLTGDLKFFFPPILPNYASLALFNRKIAAADHRTARATRSSVCCQENHRDYIIVR